MSPARLVMLLICAAEFVLQLDFSIVNVALPTIQRDFHMAASQLQWISKPVTAFTFGSLLLAGGRLADLLGRRRLLAIGLALFGARLVGLRVGAMACDVDNRPDGPGSGWRDGVTVGAFTAHNDQPGGGGA